MDISRTSDLWWKNTVFYCLDVETFQDGNGDGIGDFAGLAKRIDYLAHLGVGCIWLMPFFPSPNRDDGYDICDYYAIDPHLGTLGEFVEFIRTASDRGIRVICDLVVNHTSTEHPWFQSSRKNPHSPYRDWYVWRDEIPSDWKGGLIFPGQEDTNWTWDEEAGQYYLHRFYSHQPDLNIANPQVREEIRRIVGFWLELGLAGFRVDAVPYLLETDGIAQQMEIAPHDWLSDLRGFIGRRRGDAILLGEVNLSYQDVRTFFGADGDELTMCLDFNMNQALALALVRENAGPIVHNVRAMPSLPEHCSWAHFVRNHDEWSLDKLTAAERQEVFKAFGPRPEMQIFGRGLRRRLPTMLDGDQERIRMTYSLLASLPGSPVIFYGEEIGMAENLEIPGRLSVRAPMQWSPHRNGGFSSAPAEELRRPPVSGRKWGPKAVNVADQAQQTDSMLLWMEGLFRRRRETPEISFGTCSFLPVEDAQVLALRYDWKERSVILLHNLGRKPVTARSTLPDFQCWSGIAGLMGDAEASLSAKGELKVDLPRYGWKWLRLRPSDEAIA